jgi:mono/diheme cytochrome c family protein
VKRVALALALLVSTPAMAAPDGKAVWKEMCAPCHGARGDGRTPLGRKWGIPSFRDAEWQAAHSDDAVRDTIRGGRAGTRMRPFGSKLTSEEIDAVVGYVRKLGRSR